MESAGKRQGERAGSAESTWSAGQAAGGAGRRRSEPTSQAQLHLLLMLVDGWMSNCFWCVMCIRRL